MTKKLDIEFPRDFYLDDVGVWRLKKEKITELESSNVQTNEEWLRQASTEDVAKWLSKISKFFHECGKMDVYPKTMYEEDWEWWLKEIHNDIR